MRTAALLLVALAATVLAGPPAMPTPLYAKTTLAFTYSSTTIKFVDNYYFSSLGARFEDVFSGVSTYVASSATTYVALASGPFYNQTKSGSNAATCISSASSGPTYVASLPYQISIISTSSCTSWTTTSGVTYGGVSATQYTSSTCSLSSSYSALITSILINTYYSGSKLLGGNGTAYVSLIGSVPFTLTVNTWDTNTPASSNFTAPSSCTEIVTESSSPVATAVSSSEAATVTTGNPPAMPTALHAKTTLSFTYTSYTITFVDNYYFSSSVGSRFDDTFSGVSSAISAMSTELLALPSGPFYNVTTVGSGSPTCQSSASSGPSYISSLPYQVSVINTANCGTWTVTSGVSYGGSSATQYYSSSCSLTMSSYSSLISSIKIYLYYSGSTLLGGNGTATVSIIGTVPFTLAVNTWDASTPASSYFDVPSSCTAITSSEIAAAVESSDPATVVTESSATAVVTESSDSTVLPPAQAEGSYMKVQLAITYAAASISIAFNEETYVGSSAARSDSKFGGFSLLTYNFPAYNSSIIANPTTGITWSTMETASSSYCNTTSDGASKYKILRRHLSIINFYKCTWKMSTVTVSGTAVDRYTSSDCVVDMASLSSIVSSLSISLDYESGGSKLLNGTGTAKISSFSIPATITVKQYTSATQSSSLFTIPSLCGTSSTVPQLPVPLHMASKIAFSTSLVSATIYDDLYLTSSDMRWDFNFSGISGFLSSVVMRVVASSSSDKIYNYTKSGTSAAACKTSSSGGSALVSASRYKLDTAYLNKCSWTVTSGVTYGSTSATQYHSDACNFYGVSATGLNLYYDGDELLGGSGSGTLTYNSQTYTADVTVTVTTWDTSSIASSTFASLQCSSTSAGTTAVVSSLLAFIAVFVSLL